VVGAENESGPSRSRRQGPTSGPGCKGDSHLGLVSVPYPGRQKESLFASIYYANFELQCVERAAREVQIARSLRCDGEIVFRRSTPLCVCPG
jgi:hypothetical protein